MSKLEKIANLQVTFSQYLNQQYNKNWNEMNTDFISHTGAVKEDQDEFLQELKDEYKEFCEEQKINPIFD